MISVEMAKNADTPLKLKTGSNQIQDIVVVVTLAINLIFV
jgi:hypothetical protein